MVESPVPSPLAEERWQALQRALRTSTRFALLKRLSSSDFPLAHCVDVDTGTQLVVRLVDLRDQRISSGKAGAAPPDVVMVDDDTALVVALFVEGRSLREGLEGAAWGRPELLRLADQILEQGTLALDSLHDRGWTHGDVGPHNFLQQDGQITLVGELWSSVQAPPRLPAGIDPRAAEGTRLCELGFPDALGRAGYVAPAQLDHLDARGRDYYALAATALRVLAFEVPYAAQLDAVLASSSEFRSMLPAPASNTDMPVPRHHSERPAGLLLRLLLRLAGRLPQERLGGPAAEPRPFEKSEPDVATSPPTALRDDAQFTVYRPRSLDKERFSTLLVFAHSALRGPDEEPDAPPAAVRQRARERLKSEFSSARAATVDSLSVPLDATLRLEPQVVGAEFNPPWREFKWLEEQHVEEFRVRALAHVPEGTRLTGSLQVLFGRLLLAEINLTFEVKAGLAAPAERDVSTAHAYRKIFVSYSTRDADVVSEVRQYIRLLGDTIIQDCVDLRSGELWAPRIEELIRSADVFQLFWSTNAMQSRFVEQEWRYALTLDKPNFVRPLYWETPLPADPARGIPPDELGRIHFQPLSRWNPGHSTVTLGMPARDPQPPAYETTPLPRMSGSSRPYDAAPSARLPSTSSALPRLLFVVVALVGLVCAWLWYFH